MDVITVKAYNAEAANDHRVTSSSSESVHSWAFNVKRSSYSCVLDKTDSNGRIRRSTYHFTISDYDRDCDLLMDTFSNRRKKKLTQVQDKSVNKIFDQFSIIISFQSVSLHPKGFDKMTSNSTFFSIMMKVIEIISHFYWKKALRMKNVIHKYCCIYV